jgi:hypothetical protein
MRGCVDSKLKRICGVDGSIMRVTAFKNCVKSLIIGGKIIFVQQKPRITPFKLST